MKVLAIDSSNQPLSVALLDDQKILFTTTMTAHRKHARYLLPIIQDMFKKSSLTPQDLDRVVVADGPGSFTGLRIAVTTAKTLAFTLHIDLVGVSSLLDLALNVQNEGALVNPIFDARNQNLFTGLYQIKNGIPQSIIPDQHVSIDDWTEKLSKYKNQFLYVVGNADHFKSNLKHVFSDHLIVSKGINNLPQAANLGLFGENKTPVSDVNKFVPNYLRLTKAEFDWKQQHPKAANKDDQSYVNEYTAKI
ncbi:tRNA (adenosine(37)-N6)-threonylcarbamoyltransferase complex dimerization subunit type 1 TsaB [Philodulcilactobacillus myokoensis]|uniref:tRNA (Adenosine(37)-N6)-threonylcarbamoyltransferase complex dimerization subunit type 1 TsaB n=1 Tax=Philodulcilactobacillus myokoensis TaxID=2929573 RepID=A0A9W6ETQ1_9LACO|nr:tRNA (adenosine(37)-N6)-threonylcarbamoyltransferase complex dimerization subunit type 1 TsaB [Philodulcilactobacillus myokoensis]GLB47154.1 tRNA (adenosine(37)-N6)-threonylcarbamoyltransferase complex dimerization subunit type 1 TsaB [Philodulcilactobacillus myokoensis]